MNNIFRKPGDLARDRKKQLGGSLPRDVRWDQVADPKRWIRYVQGSDGVLPLQVGIEEKGVPGHHGKCIWGFEDGKSSGLEEGDVDMVEHGVLDIDIFNFLRLP